jgi:hypothetical protein
MKTLIRSITLLFILTLFAPSPLWSQEGKDKKTEQKKDDEAIHNELRVLRDGLKDAVLKGDIEKQLTYVSKNVVVTWQNGEVARGHDGLKAFLAKGGGGKIFQGYKEAPTPTELTILYGDDTGISFGTSVAKYSIAGQDFELKNHWSATVVKEDGNWVIANYHVSGNILDNPLLNAAKTYLYAFGAVALIFGLALGWIFRRMTAK